MNEIFYLKKKINVVIQIFEFFMNPQTSKFVTVS